MNGEEAHAFMVAAMNDANAIVDLSDEDRECLVLHLIAEGRRYIQIAVDAAAAGLTVAGPQHTQAAIAYAMLARYVRDGGLR